MLKRLNYFEPARVRAVFAAVVALALALGLTMPREIDDAVTALVAVLAVLLPILQGELTRAAVTPATVAGMHVADLDPAADVEADDADDDSNDPGVYVAEA